MAQDPEQVISFLEDLAKRARPFAEQDLAELRQFAKEELGLDHLEAWDLPYASEKLQERRYAFSAQEVKQYFPEHKVIDGLFRLVQSLFSVTIAADTATTWHKDVRFFRIERDGKLIGQFYLDLYARAGKSGGAWMDDARGRRVETTGALQTPVAYLTCNFTEPATVDGVVQPSLFTHDEVITLFHEFGHGLHHMLTQVDEIGVSGISGVEWDAVELPSQFMENFCWEWDVLEHMTAHVKTGEPLPRALYDKMLAAKNFQSGLQTLRQVEFSLLDMHLHYDYDPAGAKSVQQLIDEVRAQFAVVVPPAFNRFLNSFGHIFAGEDMAEGIQETVERRWHDDGELRAQFAVDQLLHRFRAGRIIVVMQVHVEQRELDLSQRLQAGLEVLRRQHLVVQRARQRLAGLHVGRHMLQHVPLPAEVFHELRRQFNGIPLDAGNAGHADLVDLRQHVVQAVAEFVEQRDDFIVREQRRLDHAVDRGRFGEIAGQKGHRRLQRARGFDAPAARVVHPRAAALAGARVQVEVELADQLAVAFDAEEAHVLVPGRRRVRRDGHREQALHQAEQAVDDFVFGEVLLHFLGREGVAALLQFFRCVGQVPCFQVIEAQFFLGELAQLGQVLLGERTRALGQVFEEADDLLRVLRHLRHQRHFGEVFIAEQLGFLVAQFQQRDDVLRVVPLVALAEHLALLGRLGGVGAVDGLAQRAVVGELQDREIGREVQRELVALLAILFGGGARGLLDVVRQAGQLGLVGDQQLVVVGRVEHVFREARRDGRVFFLDVGVAFLLLGRQLGAAHAEVAHGVVDDALARRRQAGEAGVGLDGLVFVEQRLVLRQRGPELGDLGLVIVVGGAQLGRVDHIVQMADDAPGAAQQLGRVLQRRDEVVPRDLRHRRFQRGDDGAVLLQQRVDGGTDVVRRDGVEARQAGEIEQGILYVS